MRLVDLDAVIDCIEMEWGYEGIREDLYSLPVVDAVPVVHAKWIPFHKRRILIAEHSPIRRISVSWIWEGVKSWIATHWSRHKWECFISTQRTDRTGTPRDKLPQDAPVIFEGEANVQALIDTMRKRLCCQADRETRAYASDLKATLHIKQPEISDVLVPNCVYRCGCPELESCDLFKTWQMSCADIASTDIQKRYDAYNTIFWAVRGEVFDGRDSGD